MVGKVKHVIGGSSRQLKIFANRQFYIRYLSDYCYSKLMSIYLGYWICYSNKKELSLYICQNTWIIQPKVNNDVSIFAHQL